MNHKKKEYYEFTRDEMVASLQRLEQQMSGRGPDDGEDDGRWRVR